MASTVSSLWAALPAWPSLPRADTQAVLVSCAGVTLVCVGYVVGRYAATYAPGGTNHAGPEQQPPVLRRTYSDDSISSVMTTGNGELEGKSYMALCIRTDLRMGKGSTAKLCCNAVRGLLKKANSRSGHATHCVGWEAAGGTWVTLSCASEEEMLGVKRAAKAMHVQAHVMLDTVRNGAEKTYPMAVMALGPAPHAVMRSLTAHLKRLK